MKVERYLDSRHHSMLAEWWAGWDWPTVDRLALPSYGLIAWEGEKPIAAGFLYETDSSICWIEWIVTNPNTTQKQRHSGIDHVIRGLVDRARRRDFATIFSSTNHTTLKDKYALHGANVTDSSVTHYAWRLN